MNAKSSMRRIFVLAGLTLAALGTETALAGPIGPWYLIEGRFAGELVKATDDEAPAAVFLFSNPHNSAEGQIAATDTGCQPPPVGTHFHGTLFGASDPDPTGCGWGRAILHKSKTDGIEDLSDAIRHEVDAFRLLVILEGTGAEPGDLGRKSLDAASRALDAVQRELDRQAGRGVIAAEERAEIQQTLDLARALDRGVDEALDAGDVDTAVDLLRDAIDAKRTTFARLAEALL